MKLFRTKTFKKEYAKTSMTDTQYAKYLKYLAALLLCVDHVRKTFSLLDSVWGQCDFSLSGGTVCGREKGILEELSTKYPFPVTPDKTERTQKNV